jgi:hypothetical protein
MGREHLSKGEEVGSEAILEAYIVSSESPAKILWVKHVANGQNSPHERIIKNAEVVADGKQPTVSTLGLSSIQCVKEIIQACHFHLVESI